MKRRTAIQAGLAAVFAGIATRAAGQGRVPQILLRNAWQITNIGDIAHAVGMLNRTVLSIAQAPQVTRVRVGAARDFVLQLYRSMMSQLDRILPG